MKNTSWKVHIDTIIHDLEALDFNSKEARAVVGEQISLAINEAELKGYTTGGENMEFLLKKETKLATKRVLEEQKQSLLSAVEKYSKRDCPIHERSDGECCKEIALDRVKSIIENV